jgi:type 1 fimbria pilin
MNAFASRLMLTLLLAPPAFAASTSDLSVKGSITPSACEPLISGGSVVDFGKISVGSPMPTNSPALPIKACT